jgi:hypothetical protein
MSAYLNLYEIRGNATKLNLEDNEKVDFYSSLTDSIYNVKAQNKDFPNSTQRENIVTADGLSFTGPNPYIKCICPLKCPACYQKKNFPTIPYNRPFQYVNKEGKESDDKLEANIGPGGDGPGGKPAGGPLKGKSVDAKTNADVSPAEDDSGQAETNAEEDSGQAESKENDDESRNIYTYLGIDEGDNGDDGNDGDNGDNEGRGVLSVLHPVDQQVASIFGQALLNFVQTAVGRGITTLQKAIKSFPDQYITLQEQIKKLYPEETKKDINKELQKLFKDKDTVNNLKIQEEQKQLEELEQQQQVQQQVQQVPSSIIPTNNTDTLNSQLYKIAITAVSNGYNTANEAIEKYRPNLLQIKSQFPTLPTALIYQNFIKFFEKSEDQKQLEQNKKTQQELLNLREEYLNEGAKQLFNKQPANDYIKLLEAEPFKLPYRDIYNEMQFRARKIDDDMRAQRIREQEQAYKNFESLIAKAFTFVLNGNLEESDKIRDQLYELGYSQAQMEDAFKEVARNYYSNYPTILRNIESYIKSFITSEPLLQIGMEKEPINRRQTIINTVQEEANIRNPLLRRSNRFANIPPSSGITYSKRDFEEGKMSNNLLKEIVKKLEIQILYKPLKRDYIDEILNYMQKNNLTSINIPTGNDVSLGKGFKKAKRKHPVWKKILKGSQLAGNGSKRIKLLLS